MCARPARARATTQLRLKPWPERRELCLLAVSGSPATRSLQAAGRGNMIEMDAEEAAQPPPLPSPSLSLPLPFLFLSSPSPPPLPPSGPWIREASLYVKFSVCRKEEEIIHFDVPEDHSVPLCQLSSLGLLVGPAASSCPETRDGGYRRRETFSPAMSTNFPEPHGVCHNMLRSI